MEKYGGIREATGDSMTQCGKMQFACMLSEATTALLEYAIYIVFHGSSGYGNVSQCFITYTLPVLSYILNMFTEYVVYILIIKPTRCTNFSNLF